MGKGGQAEVYECTIDGMEGKYATKFRTALNNQKSSKEFFENSFAEFAIASDLKHPNIIEYKYFKKQQDLENHEYHIVMELMEGPDMK